MDLGRFDQLAGLIAPRYFFAESGNKDPIFPLAAAQSSFVELQKVYQTLGVPERCAHEVFEGPHVFHGGAGWPFVRKALGGA